MPRHCLLHFAGPQSPAPVHSSPPRRTSSSAVSPRAASPNSSRRRRSFELSAASLRYIADRSPKNPGRASLPTSRDVLCTAMISHHRRQITHQQKLHLCHPRPHLNRALPLVAAAPPPSPCSAVPSSPAVLALSQKKIKETEMMNEREDRKRKKKKKKRKEELGLLTR